MASDRPRAPSSTYRLQFNRDFRLGDAARLLPHLSDLGIADIYASPLLKARAGSLHGYDVTEPHSLDPEIGDDADLQALEAGLRSRAMGLLLDIVPNHMAASSENPWWADVLEYGPVSPYSRYFDIDWAAGDPGDGRPRVVLPVLGKTPEEALHNGELQPALQDGRPGIRYYEQWFPLSPATYHLVLPEEPKGVHREARRLASSQEPPREGQEALKQRVRDATAHHAHREAIEERLRELGDDPAALVKVMDAQHYRLVHWRETLDALNYRRFFDITDLAAVRVEDSDVFEDTHRLVFSWIERGLVTGLRIDHIDGLYDPYGYLAMLQEQAGQRLSGAHPFYVVVEKILGPEEELPGDWQAAGTSGYEFMNLVNNVFVDPAGLRKLTDAYHRFIGEPEHFERVTGSSKQQVIRDLFAGEMRSLVRDLRLLAQRDTQTGGLPAEDLEQALLETTTALPVYRTYIRDAPVTPRDLRYIERAMGDAAAGADAAALSFLRRVLLLEDLPGGLEADALAFVRRWQQFTGPVMAKGVEDTAFYRYNRLISMNEVGGDPGEGAVSIEQFHASNRRALERSPYRLNATSTHDSKRSEDVRARINVISDIPDEWSRAVSEWSRINEPLKPELNGRTVPDRREEMLLYQALVGAWPLSREEEPEFRDRLKAATTKGAREAKINTSWLRINERYEEALRQFIDRLLDGPNGFLDSFRAFQEKVAFYGAVNSLGQVVLKTAAPGVPDFYRGTELWDLSLVDPDNRRPVDFEKRVRMLRDLQAGARTEELLSTWRDGRIKLYVTWKSLQLRRKQIDVFLEGDCIPLYASGQHREHVVAFARHLDGRAVIAAVPRGTGALTEPGVWPVGEAWQEESLEIPEALGGAWRNAFTGIAVSVGGRLPLREVFAGFPAALLEQSV